MRQVNQSPSLCIFLLAAATSIASSLARHSIISVPVHEARSFMGPGSKALWNKLYFSLVYGRYATWRLHNKISSRRLLAIDIWNGNSC